MRPLSSPKTDSFEPLQQAFVSYLKETNFYPGLTHVRCSERGGRLLLLAEHSAPEIDTPNALLKTLETAFRDLVSTVGLPDGDWVIAAGLSVRIYLKLKAAVQPYAIHTFTWRPGDAVGVVFPAEPFANPVDASAEQGLNTEVETDLAVVDYGADWVESGQPRVDPSAAGLASSDAALALPDVAIQPPEERGWVYRGRTWSGQGLRSLRYYWSYGLAALILVGSGAFVFALTRPCVVGRCDRIEQAAEFYEQAQVTLDGRPSGDDLAIAQADLQAAIDLLAPVPTWSSRYEAVQSDLQRYRGSIVSLNALIQGQAIASEAADLSQSPPHPVERWVNVHMLWQQAVDWLASIPVDSPAYDYSQQKLREYRSNYSAIGRRIVAEEGAEANFSTAIQTANLARQRTETANSLAGWQLATKEWQAAIRVLSLIPQGTMVYDEAQVQLSDYRQQLSQVSNRSKLEEAGARSYNQAVQAARAAAAYEAKGQW
ncbi:MAG: hypothetical protein WBB18_19460, partial [Nodosilinea sp.]